MTADHLFIAAAAAGASALALAIVLGFIELRLRALFARHEVREEKMHATAVLTAEGASAGTRENSRHIHEIRLEVAAQRVNVANLSELLRDQEARLASVEKRLVRVAITVPHPTRDPEGP